MITWSPRSSATRALWMLEELQGSYQVETIDIRAEPRRDPPDFLEASPMGKVPALLQVLENRLAEGPWIAGETFSAADVTIGSACYFLKSIDLVSPNSAMSAYIDRCLKRPAYQRALARDAA